MPTRGPFALGDPGSSNHVDVVVGCQEQAVLIAGGSGWDGAGSVRFPHAT